jgi:hypothetical protein
MSSSSFPSFPFDVQKRIIHFALALTPSYPDAINAYDPVSTSWDVLAGCNGRNAIRQRYEERLGVQRAALQLMRVCKPWKVGIPLGNGEIQPDTTGREKRSNTSMPNRTSTPGFCAPWRLLCCAVIGSGTTCIFTLTRSLDDTSRLST